MKFNGTKVKTVKKNLAVLEKKTSDDAIKHAAEKISTREGVQNRSYI